MSEPFLESCLKGGSFHLPTVVNVRPHAHVTPAAAGCVGLPYRDQGNQKEHGQRPTHRHDCPSFHQSSQLNQAGK